MSRMSTRVALSTLGLVALLTVASGCAAAPSDSNGVTAARAQLAADVTPQVTNLNNEFQSIMHLLSDEFLNVAKEMHIVTTPPQCLYDVQTSIGQQIRSVGDLRPQMQTLITNEVNGGDSELQALSAMHSALSAAQTQADGNNATFATCARGNT